MHQKLPVQAYLKAIAYLKRCSCPVHFQFSHLHFKIRFRYFCCIFWFTGRKKGPMVHLGAALGKGISQGRLTKQLDQYQTAQQRRNFLSAGAAAGIGKFIVNSKLPYVAGLTGKTVLINNTFINYTSCRLWKPCWRYIVRHGRSCILLEYAIDMANLLLCNGSITFTTNTFSTAFQGFTLGSLPFGVYTKTHAILFEVEKQLPVNLFMLIPVVVVGVLCGFLACIFTFINLRVTRWRSKHIFPHKILRIFRSLRNRYCCVDSSTIYTDVI